MTPVESASHSPDGRRDTGLAHETARAPLRAYVVVPEVRTRQSSAGGPHARSAQARLDEAVGLARAIDLDIVGQGIVRIAEPRPATLIGQGKVEELKGLILAEEIGLVVVDAPLTPAQQRNLERAWNAKVLDRTGLILEIFGERARTREGRLQVELAHLNWQKSRLVRSWTHLERQRGGFGFLGGPGETQIETDRRLIQERIARIEKELESVRRTRGLHRDSRRRVPFPVVALVGYTNAGKSTLFNRLTRAEVLARDMLFATLDPTLRAVRLPGGRRVILSDTVGFISDLPTDLVAAFRATLEEVLEADLILHVRDVSHPDSAAQAADVTAILDRLGVDAERSGRVLDVLNKVDLLDPVERGRLEASAGRQSGQVRPILMSAVTGEGEAMLLAAIDERLKGEVVHRSIDLEASDGAAVNWIYERCTVVGRSDDAETGRVRLEVDIPISRRDEFDRRFPTSGA